MSDLFALASRRIKDSYLAIWVFVASVAMLVIGANHFIEDTLSSRYGLAQLELVFGIIPVSYPLTYWTESLAPQIGQIVFGYMFLTDSKKNRWAGLLFILFLGIDFFADSWYRSNQQLFASPEQAFASIAITLGYFTIGSELFITVGFGMVAELFVPFLIQTKRLVRSIAGAQGRAPAPNNTIRNQRPAPQPQNRQFNPGTNNRDFGALMNRIYAADVEERDRILEVLPIPIRRQAEDALQKHDQRMRH